ncbi:MAG: hypothetical protein L3I99_04610 [Sulfurimonas sp.]|nr:hypothetical protein [Sulfurimonas sp.]
MIFANFINMKRILLIITLIVISLNFSGCINKHGISAKYYSDCKEYYDMQGYYHKKCGDDDIVTYKAIGEFFEEEETKPKSNVW